MKKIIKHTLCLLLLLSSRHLSAQNTVGNEEVTVVKQHEISLQDADRIGFSPTVPEFEVKKQSFDYDVPEKEFRNFTFEPNPLKPLALAKEKLEKFKTSYIKLGFGSQLTPLAQFAYNDNNTKNLKFGLWYDHLSQYGFKIKNQRFSSDGAGVYVNYFPKTIETGLSFNFENLRNHFYAFPDSVLDAKALRQIFRTYEGNVWLRDASRNKIGLGFDQQFTFNYFTEKTGVVNEWFFRSNTELDYCIKMKHYILVGLTADVSQYKGDTIAAQQRNLFLIQLGYLFNNDDWKAKVSFTAGIDGKQFLPLPDLLVEKRAFEHALIPYVGFKMEILKNSFQNFARENNFLHSQQLLLNTRLLMPYVGLKGTVDRFNYNFAFSYKRFTMLPLFINDTLDMKRFTVVYDTGSNVYNVRAELGYNYKEQLQLVISGEYNFYELSNLAQPWHLPAFKVGLKARYNWENKIIAGLEVFGLANSKALVRANEGPIKTITGTGDLNLSLEYIFSKYLSFFGNLNNIAHQRYQRYYGYPSYGINGLVGAKFTF